MRKVLTLNARSKSEAIDVLSKAIESLKNNVAYDDTNIYISVSVPDDNMKTLTKLGEEEES